MFKKDSLDKQVHWQTMPMVLPALTILALASCWPLEMLAWEFSQSRDFSVTESNADIIVKALEQYHTENSVYPTTLADLEPGHLTTLPEAVTTRGMGWLYTSTGGQYTLGYWQSVYEHTAVVCLYTSQDAVWNCTNHCRNWPIQEPEGCWGPFTPVPTPTCSPVPE